MGYGSTEDDAYALDAEFAGNYGRFANDPRGVDGQSANVTAETRFNVRGEAYTAMVAKGTIRAGDEILMSYGKEHRLMSSLWTDTMGEVLTREHKISAAPYPNMDDEKGEVANQLLWECCQCGRWSLTSDRVLGVEYCGWCRQPRVANVRVISVLAAPPITECQLQREVTSPPTGAESGKRFFSMKRIRTNTTSADRTPERAALESDDIDSFSSSGEEEEGLGKPDSTPPYSILSDPVKDMTEFFKQQLKRISLLDDDIKYEEDSVKKEEEEEVSSVVTTTTALKRSETIMAEGEPAHRQRGRPRLDDAEVKQEPTPKVSSGKRTREEAKKGSAPSSPAGPNRYTTYESTVVKGLIGVENVKSPLSRPSSHTEADKRKPSLSAAVDWPMNVPFLPWQVWDPSVPLTASFTHSKYASSSDVLVYAVRNTMKTNLTDEETQMSEVEEDALKRTYEGPSTFLCLTARDSPATYVKRSLLCFEKRLFSGKAFQVGDVVGYVGGVIRERADARLSPACSPLRIPLLALLPPALKTCHSHGSTLQECEEGREALQDFTRRCATLEYIVTNEWMYAPCLSYTFAATGATEKECQELLEECNTVFVLSVDSLGSPFVAAIATRYINVFEPMLARTQ
ncbi:hypothetical protein AGDE_12786 [Angomonas deanei]|nr:hypothetical protein AGDE_12786 [Angomonas deanei]|eukprot:EPY23511.1 hypothetical protein AGDE_12786 [Angomonas deanei]